MILASQMYIDLFFSNFRVSFGAIALPVIIYKYRDIRVYYIGFISGLVLYLQRIIVYSLGTSNLAENVFLYWPEIIFYSVYGFLFVYLVNKNERFKILNILLYLILIDFLSNISELIMLIDTKSNLNYVEIIKLLIIVAIIRSFISTFIITSLKYYKIFLVKEDHEKRYRDLIWMTSKFKTQIYWMEKNMTYIENVMEDAYSLFESIKENKNKEIWQNKSLDIAKNVHEIKKEYHLVLSGIEEVLKGNSSEKGLSFSEILNILEDSLYTMIKNKNKKIILDFENHENFYTSRHYELISILRNILTNSIEAMNEGKIELIHTKNNSSHIFVIKDSGKGIKEKDIKNIFKAGFSTKINYNTGDISRGLGLNLVKKLIEKDFNGKISVFSLENIGTTFTIAIPIKDLEEG